MKTNILLLLSLCCTCFLSCYKDKGNYEYTKLYEVTINMTPPSTAGFVGEPYIYTPEVVLENPGDTDKFKYWWEYTTALLPTGQPWIVEGKELRFTPTATGRFGWQFCVQEKSTGVVTTSSLYITVTAVFNRGWMVLSDVGGKSVMSFIKPQWLQTESGKVRQYTLYDDLYKEYSNDPLGTSPYGLYQALKSSAGSAILLMQESGPVWLNANSFTPEVTLNSEFLGAPPAGFQLKGYVEASYLAATLSRDGKVYTRYIPSPTAFYTDAIMNFPTEFAGSPVNISSIIPMGGITNFGAYGLYDKAAGRVLWLNNDYYFPSAVFPSLMNATGEYLDFTNLGSSEIMYCAPISTGVASAPLLTIYKKNGDYYLQQATASFVRNAMQNVTLTVTKHKLFPGNGLVSDNTSYFELETRPYLFFAEKNKVYWYDINSEAFHNIYTFPEGETIVGLGSNPQESELGVALESGTFATINIENSMLYSDLKVWETRVPGKVISLKYKFANGTEYSNRVRIQSYWD